MSPEEFKQNRKDLKLTQPQLAKELGLSEKNGDVYIRKVEKGRSQPSGLLIRCFELFYERELKAKKIPTIFIERQKNLQQRKWKNL